jgi:hypothetical protein
MVIALFITDNRMVKKESGQYIAEKANLIYAWLHKDFKN